MARLRALFATGLLVSLGAAGLVPVAAQADDTTPVTFDGTVFCPASGTLAASDAAALAPINDLTTIKAQGGSIVYHGVLSTGSTKDADYDSYDYYSAGADRFTYYAKRTQVDGIKGVLQTISYDFGKALMYRRYNQSLINNVQAAAAKQRLKHTTVWTRTALVTRRDAVLQNRVNSNFNVPGWVTSALSDTGGSATCTVTDTVVTYKIKWATGNVMTAAVTFNQDSTPAQLAETFTEKASKYKEVGTATITYGEPATSKLLFPTSTSAVYAPATWRQAFAKTVLSQIKSYGLSDAKYYASKKSSTTAKVAAIRKGVLLEKPYLSSYYFYASDWTATVHFAKVTKGEKVWLTDPKTKKKLWITVKLNSKKKVVAADNF